MNVRELGSQHGHIAGELEPIWAAIRARRLEQRLAIRKLAAKAGVSPSTISRGERGYHAWLDATRRVATALGLAIDARPSDDLLDDIGDRAYERSQDQ